MFSYYINKNLGLFFPKKIRKNLGLVLDDYFRMIRNPISHFVRILSNDNRNLAKPDHLRKLPSLHSLCRQTFPHFRSYFQIFAENFLRILLNFKGLPDKRSCTVFFSILFLNKLLTINYGL